MTPLTLERHIGCEHFLTDLDRPTFSARFNRAPFMIGHHLTNNRLFSLSRLIELSKFLPEKSVEYNSGKLPVSQDPNITPRNGLSIAETIERIEQCSSWMVLKNVEQDPEYRDVLYDCLDEMRPLVDQVAPGMRVRQAFVFISSAGSITPFHIDPENNFLLQIRGNKRVQLFDAEDRFVMSEEQLEKFFTGAHRNMPYQPEFENRGTWYDLKPGDGLHFPVAAPHWVKNGSEVSISFSITFQTDSSQRRQSLHRWNNSLRRFGLKPRNVGKHVWADELKFAAVRCGRFAKKLIGRHRD